jgi:uncharacterized membrane protein (DUF106 family)
MSFLDPVFRPLLGLDPLFIVIIISAIITVLITTIYKFTTNQNLMKQLKGEMKEFQKEMKELKDDPKKMMEVNKKAMQTNMKYMSHSMRSTLITFIPIILIFGWMNANIAYEPIQPNQEFTVEALFAKGTDGTIELIVPKGISSLGEAEKDLKDNKATWTLKGKEGNYIDNNALEFKYNNEVEYKNLIITNKQQFSPINKKISDSKLKMIQINNKPMKVLNLFGWKIGWLGTYIIFSILLSMLLRKLLKVY